MLSETNIQHEKDVGTRISERGQTTWSGTGRNRLKGKGCRRRIRKQKKQKWGHKMKTAEGVRDEKGICKEKGEKAM